MKTGDMVRIHPALLQRWEDTDVYFPPACCSSSLKVEEVTRRSDGTLVSVSVEGIERWYCFDIRDLEPIKEA